MKHDEDFDVSLTGEESGPGSGKAESWFKTNQKASLHQPKKKKDAPEGLWTKCPNYANTPVQYLN